MKFSKIIASLVFLAIAGLFMPSCSDFLDVNDDPNSITEANEALRLSGLLGEFSFEMMANSTAYFSSMWMQQVSFNGTPPTEDNYDINATDVNDIWVQAYSDEMINAKRLVDVATTNENWAYVAIGKTILAWTAIRVTNFWGDVPFSEALNGANSTTPPKFDSQESIFLAAQALLDEAIAALGKSSVLTPSADDLLYGGDMTKWSRMIYTLKARLYLQLSRAPGYDEAQQAQKALDALQNGFQSNDDNAVFEYFTEPGSQNPWYQFAVSGAWFDTYRLSKQYVQLLQGLNDPRLAVQARPNINGLYKGHMNGEPPINNDIVSPIGVYYASKGADLTWINYAEAKFIEAEATLILQGPAAADPIFKDAVTASLNELSISAADQAAYLGSLPSLSATNALEQIITQKYIANYLKAQMYNDWRRTGYPTLTVITNAYVPVIPLRFVAPNSVLNNNIENYEATGIPVGQDAMTIPVWWDSAN